MRLIRNFKSRKYLQRLSLSVMLPMVLLIVCTAVALYVSAESKVRAVQEEANSKLMYQIEYNITSMNDMLMKLAVSVLYNNDLVALRLQSPINAMEKFNKEKQLEMIVSMNSFLDSIGVYNPYHDQLYTGGQSLNNRRNPLYIHLYELAGSDVILPKLRLIPLNLDRSGQPDLITYVINDKLTPNHDQSMSSLFLNIRIDWLIENIKLINQTDSDSKSAMFIADADGELLISDDNSSEGIGHAQSVLSGIDFTDVHRERRGFIEATIDGSNKRISYLSIDAIGWSIFIVQPNEQLLGRQNVMKLTAIAFTSIFLILSVLVSLWVSARLYAPVGRLFSQVKALDANAVRDEGVTVPDDELSFVSNVYSAVLHRLEIVEKEYSAKQNVVQQYYLRSLLTDSGSFSKEQFTEMVKQHGFNMDAEGPYMVTVFRMDQLEQWLASTSEREQNLYRFAIRNITAEILGAALPSVVLAVKPDHFVVVSNYSPGCEQNWIELTKQTQQVVFDYYKISISAAVSDQAASHAAITMRYSEALQMVKYKFIYGYQSVITSAVASKHKSKSAAALTPELEQKLEQCVKSHRLDMIASCLDEILARNRDADYDSLMMVLFQIVFVIRRAIQQMNQNRLVPVMDNAGDMYRSISQLETIDQYKEKLLELLQDMDSSERGNSDKLQAIIDTMKEYIEMNYDDPALNLQGIAANLFMSVSYIGRVFKRSAGVSVAQYLNEIRLCKAAALLLDPKHTVNDVWEQVGYTNQSYFFTLFRKRFGVTPREYRIKQAIEADD